MKETENSASSGEEISADSSCSCLSDACNCGKNFRRKSLRTAICLLVLLAVGGIIAFKIINADSSIAFNEATDFDFGQTVFQTTSNEDNTVQADQRIGEYVESLNALNTVAVNDDVVFIFIPDSENALADDATKTAVFNAQRYLKRANIEAGLYSLSYDSTDYSEIAKQVELPAIIVARKGSSVIAVSGSNADESLLLRAYLSCCDADASVCCP